MKKLNKSNGLFLNGLIFKTLSIITFMLALSGVNAQTVSGTWDAVSTTGSTGYINHGNGVIQLLDVNSSNNCQASAIHETSATYNPALGTPFSKCYEVFFGCPGSDEIGADTKGDGMAFSFWNDTATYNINNGLACGGGLGYMGAVNDNKMITIEFDTYSSAFDGSYGGGLTGNHDEISVHFDGDAGVSGLVTAGIDGGNLEDGLEHTVCITYTPATDILLVTIDGNTVLSLNLGATYNLETYFSGTTGLNQTWSSGKYGATNPTTVSTGADISDNLGGGTLCPSTVTITSASSFSSCSPVVLSATVSPPTGNTVSYVEFFVDGASIGTDNTGPYSMTWGTPTDGNHNVVATAHYTPSGTTASTASIPFNVGTGGIQLTTTAPTINGAIDAVWASYPAYTLTKGNGATGADLSAYYKMMYTATYLYVLVDVTDDVIVQNGPAGWQDDGVEIFIDINNEKPGCCGLNAGAGDYQLTYIATTGAIAANTAGPSGSIYSKQNRAGGYIMEFRFTWTSLLAGYTPTVGTSLGFDVGINDDDDNVANSDRDNQLIWYANAGSNEFENASLFGTHQFSNCDPLPVNLLSFSGAWVFETIALEWMSAGEVNNEKFVIERSSNGIDWSDVGVVNGAGNTNALMNYSFVDYSPLSGVSYYRLRQVDKDQSIYYSEIIALKNSSSTISIVPNPFENNFKIVTSSKGEINIKMYDVIGRVVFESSTINSTGEIVVNPELSSGAYTLSVQSDTFIEQHKIIKR